MGRRSVVSEFTASNGWLVQRDRHGWAQVTGITRTTELSTPEVEALREFFLHERDTELGRWRWPENPDYVVYPNLNDVVRVLREGNAGGPYGPGVIRITRAESLEWDEEGARNFYAAARAYFEAHPAPPPWRDAKPGEVWVLDGKPYEVVDDTDGVASAGPRFFLIDGVDGFTPGCSPSEFTEGRRIWPEVSNG